MSNKAAVLIWDWTDFVCVGLLLPAPEVKEKISMRI